jgi:hypothetical protein
MKTVTLSASLLHFSDLVIDLSTQLHELEAVYLSTIKEPNRSYQNREQRRAISKIGVQLATAKDSLVHNFLVDLEASK